MTADAQEAVRVVLSPGLDAGQLRIVLTWRDKPDDLDAHLEGPLPDGRRFHVYFREKGDLASEEFVRLDVDDRDGQGPETITVLGVLPGTYRYYVHDYSNRNHPQAAQLAASGAQVKVYLGGQAYRFTAGHEMRGNVWNVCTIEVTPGGEALVQKTDTYQETETTSLGLYSKRTMAHRESWIGRYGGSQTSETAVAAGLEWLARHQADNGSWSRYCLDETSSDYQCDDPSNCQGEGGLYEMAHSGLALLAFQAGGHYYFNDNEYSDRVRRGLDWMVDHQGSNGLLVGTRPKGGFPRYPKQFLYEHGIAAFALVEACATARASGQPPNTRYQAAAKKALRFTRDVQYDDGGWRYWDDATRIGDSSVSGWQVLALKTGQQAGIPVPPDCLAKVRRFFNDRAGDDGQTGYENRSLSTQATTGVGMLARQFLLDEPDTPFMRAAAETLAREAEQRWADPAKRLGDQDYYLWYNCTLAMYQMGGQPWERWNTIIRDTIIGLQRRDGCAAGSWDPSTQWGAEGGRIYTTALAALTLEVYYRYAGRAELADSFDSNVSEIERPHGVELHQRTTPHDQR